MISDRRLKSDIARQTVKDRDRAIKTKSENILVRLAPLLVLATGQGMPVVDLRHKPHPHQDGENHDPGQGIENEKTTDQLTTIPVEDGGVGPGQGQDDIHETQGHQDRPEEIDLNHETLVRHTCHRAQ